MKNTLFTFFFWGFAQLLSAQVWTPVQSPAAQDISVGPGEQVWITTRTNAVMKWNGASFERVSGSATRISVGPDGNPWIITPSSSIARFDSETGNWVPVAGRARDIGVGAEGSVWAIGVKPVDGGFQVMKWNESKWDMMKEGAVRVAVGNDGTPWFVNDAHKLFYFDENQQPVEYGTDTKDVAIGADGTIWSIGTDDAIYKLEGEQWVVQEGAAVLVAVSDAGIPWVVDADGHVSRLDKEAIAGEPEGAEEQTEAGEPAQTEPAKAKPANGNQQVRQQAGDEQEGNKPAPAKPAPAPVRKAEGTVNFYNEGALPVEIYRSSATELGELVTTIRPQSTVAVPVSRGDQFEVAVDKKLGTHPKIYITNTKGTINLYGNRPISQMPGYIAGKFSVLDYQSNQLGIDLTQYNPRDLVNTIAKGQIFESLNITDGIDYRIIGDGKIMKQGFGYTGLNLHEGSNEVTMSYGYSAFSKSWSLNVGGSGSIPIPKTKATANPALDFGYSETEMENRSSENTYAYSREQKSIYVITLDPRKAPLAPEFKQAVHQVNDLASAQRFVEQYGTHYSKTIYYGGDRSVYVVMNREQYSKAKSFGIDIKAKVGVSMDQVKSKKTNKSTGNTTEKSASQELGEGHLGFDFRQGSEEASVFENVVSKYRMIGGSGGFDGWQVDETNAAPIAAEMDLIYTLIEPDVFKDDTDPEMLAVARSFIQQAVDLKLSKMPLLKAPLPAPRVYTIIVDRMEVTKEVDDANKNTRGSLSASVSYLDNGRSVAAPGGGTFWSKPDYSMDFKFVKGTIVYPNATFRYVDFPDSTTGKFRTLRFNISGSISEKDDNVFDDQDEMTGSTGDINIGELNLSPGQVSQPRTFELNFSAPFHENQIRVTYRIRREPSEFDEKLNKW